MMEDEVVRRRGWLSREEFLDLLGATNLIPGPNSTEMAIHVGRRRGGWPGLLVAGACFILPAARLGVLVPTLPLVLAAAAPRLRVFVPSLLAAAAPQVQASTLFLVNSSWLVLGGALLGLVLR